MRGKMPAFWFAVAGVSILSEVGLQLAAEKLPFQSLKTLAAYVSRQNG